MTVEVKRSKFVTTAWPIDSADQALQLIQSSADPTASHNCWAFKVNANTSDMLLQTDSLPVSNQLRCSSADLAEAFSN